MKEIIGILLFASSLNAFGQFPEPVNFQFEYFYIPLDDAGYCAGQYVYGPTYCSTFTWEAPDTGTVNSTFEYYKLYYYTSFEPHPDTTLIDTTTESFSQLEIGILGEVWVTAVYSDPDGESAPSNIIINEDLPISVKENPLQDKQNIFYDSQNHQITITNSNNAVRLSIFNSQGKLIHSSVVRNEMINISYLPGGLYIVEILWKSMDVETCKIIKN